jgi:hypothetical protein
MMTLYLVTYTDCDDSSWDYFVSAHDHHEAFVLWREMFAENLKGVHDEAYVFTVPPPGNFAEVIDWDHAGCHSFMLDE